MCVGRIVSEFEVEGSHKFVNGKTKPNKAVLKKIQKSARKLEKSVSMGNHKEYTEDLLAVSTRYTKEVFASIQNEYNKFTKSSFYKILVYTTQPAHLITALSVIWIAFLMVPSRSQTLTSPLWNLVYLGSFAAHFGAQIWMTFVSGLALYFTLPRHNFGAIQQVLFPKYFLMNSVLSLVCLVIFLRTNNHKLWEKDNIIQVTALSTCFMAELVIRLYLTPPLLRLIVKKTKIEKKAGVGMEIGKLNFAGLKDCPYYMSIHKTFRKIHMTIAMMNLTAMACTTLQLYYLSHKLCAI
nr:transmembrane protein 205 [Leptinotarsa decemlineata]